MWAYVCIHTWLNCLSQNRQISCLWMMKLKEFFTIQFEDLCFLNIIQCLCILLGEIAITAVAAAKLLQSCPTLCDPIDSSPPGSPIPGILKARTLEWVAISFSNAWKWRVKVKSLSCVRLLATPWTVAYQAPASMGFSRQEYWSGVPLPLFQGIFPTQGWNPASLKSTCIGRWVLYHYCQLGSPTVYYKHRLFPQAWLKLTECKWPIPLFLPLLSMVFS